MRHQNLCLLTLVITMICLAVAPAWSMPPHPDLLEKIQRGEVSEPFFLKNRDQLRDRGVDTPTRAPLIPQIMSGSQKGSFNAIAILVDFSDNVASTAAGYFDGLLYANQTGTLRDYWNEVTYGNLTIATLDLPSALGWLRAPQTYSYYVDGQHGFGSYPQNAQRLAEDAVILADPFVNFADYDNDGDGYVDALFIIHAGRGAEFTGSGDDIWSHKWTMNTPQSVDGVTTFVYSMEPEYWLNPRDMTVGVFAHEMGHSVFGLPDLYDYGYDSRGLGMWSLMAGGSWNGVLGNSPAHPDAWSRVQTGAAPPMILSSNLLAAAIPAIEDTPAVYRLWTDGAGGDEFFLVENRQKLGYDTYLPGDGVLVYHVDETQSGNDNQWYPAYTDSGHYLVALEQADSLWHLERNYNPGDIKDPYPGSTSNRTFDDSSKPDSRDYSFNSTGVAVRNISNSGLIMTADLFVTTASPPEAVDDLVATLIGADKSASGDIMLTWTEPYAEGGVDYYLIYRSTIPGSAGDSLTITAATEYVDPGAAGQVGTDHYYLVKAVDLLGRESETSNQAGEVDRFLTATE